MPNSVTVRTTAPGAKEAAGDVGGLRGEYEKLVDPANRSTAALKLGAVAFGAVTAGAQVAEQAQGKFMAATGASREEAKQFVSGLDSLAGSAGTAGKSFEEIAAVGTTVAQQFGTTGQKTTDLTEQILEFSKATGQDADAAAAALEDTLSAYGLTADDAAGFTDQLVASAQKYGTEVGPEQLDTIRKISPALQSLGGDINDAVGYLNLMEQAGLDAADGQKAFNTALTKLPPGTTFDDLVTHLADLKSQGIDPTTEAIKIFGTKAGPALAAAIQPGMTSMSDLAISAQDAQGAVHTAADGMLTSTDKINGIFEKLGAGAREVGQSFGPLASGAGALTTMAGPLVGKLGGVTTALKEQVTAAGGAKAALGGLSGQMSTLGPIAVGVAAGLVAANIAAGQVKEKADAATEAVKNMSDEELALAANSEHLGLKNKDVAAGMANITDLIGLVVPGFNSATTGTRDFADALSGSSDSLASTLDDARESASLAGAGALGMADNVLKANGIVTEAIGTDLPHAVAAAGDSFTGLGDKLTTTLDGMVPTARAGGEAISEATLKGYADGIDQSSSSVQDEWKQFLKDMNKPFDAQKEIARLNGELTGKKLAEGLASTDPITRLRAETMRDHIQAQLDDLKALGYDIGDGTGRQVAAGINDSTGAAVTQAEQLRDAVNRKIQGILNNVHVRVAINGNIKSGAAGETSLGGGMASGGSPAPHSIHEVAEDGPEMLESGGRSYLLMGSQGGRVRPFGPGAAPAAASLPPIHISVNLSAREFASQSGHYAMLQSGKPAF